MIKIYTNNQKSKEEFKALEEIYNSGEIGLFCNKDETQFYYFGKNGYEDWILEIIPYDSHISELRYSISLQSFRSRYSKCTVDDLQLKRTNIKLNIEVN